MRNAALMRGTECFGQLMTNAQRFIERHASVVQPFRQGLARDELHDEIERAVSFLESVNRGDVGMIQRGE